MTIASLVAAISVASEADAAAGCQNAGVPVSIQLRVEPDRAARAIYADVGVSSPFFVVVQSSSPHFADFTRLGLATAITRCGLAVPIPYEPDASAPKNLAVEAVPVAVSDIPRHTSPAEAPVLSDYTFVVSREIPFLHYNRIGLWRSDERPNETLVAAFKSGAMSTHPRKLWTVAERLDDLFVGFSPDSPYVTVHAVSFGDHIVKVAGMIWTP